jgi:hypothetical protein
MDVQAGAGCSILYDQTSPHWCATLDVSGLGQLTPELMPGDQSVSEGSGQRWGVRVAALCDTLQVSFTRLMLLNPVPPLR